MSGDTREARLEKALRDVLMLAERFDAEPALAAFLASKAIARARAVLAEQPGPERAHRLPEQEGVTQASDEYARGWNDHDADARAAEDPEVRAMAAVHSGRWWTATHAQRIADMADYAALKARIAGTRSAQTVADTLSAVALLASVAAPSQPSHAAGNARADADKEVAHAQVINAATPGVTLKDGVAPARRTVRCPDGGQHHHYVEPPAEPQSQTPATPPKSDLFCGATIEYGRIGKETKGFSCSLRADAHEWHVTHSDEDLSVECFRWRTTSPENAFAPETALSGEGPVTCAATMLDRATGNETRCNRPADHERHSDGVLEWTAIPEKPAAPASPAEEDKKTAWELCPIYQKHDFGVPCRECNRILAALTRVRGEEREAIALSFEKAADMTRATGGSEIDATADEARAAAIRARGERGA